MSPKMRNLNIAEPGTIFLLKFIVYKYKYDVFVVYLTTKRNLNTSHIMLMFLTNIVCLIKYIVSK